MAYEITATRKRPQNFNELIGQEFVVATLTNSISTGRIAHAYLFSGPRGVGKTSAARILAKTLNCERGNSVPCGTCSTCQEISRGNSLDVIEIDGASNTSVNDVREIKDEVLFSPNSSKYKIYIIDEVHMLSNSAFNALLKTIEEPPPYIIFIFATTEIHKVPSTIRSRCQQFNFRLISTTQIRKNLSGIVREMGLEAEEDALLWIAREATGSLRDAQTLLDQVISFSGEMITLEKIKEKLSIVGTDELNAIITKLSSGDSRGILVLIDEILNRGVAVEQFVIDLTGAFRNILFLTHGIRNETILGVFSESILENVAVFSPQQIEKAIEILLETYRKLRFSLNQRFELELALSRLARLKSLITGEELLTGIRGIKEELRSGSRSSVKSGNRSGKNREDRRQGEEEDRLDNNSVSRKDDSLDLQKDIMESLKRKKPALTSALGKAVRWLVEGDAFVLIFEGHDQFSGEMIRKERELLQSMVSDVLGRNMRVRIKYRQEEKQDEEDEIIESQVDIVKKVFKGELVDGSNSHFDEPK